jgi:3D (Asp-Asp-Asp) domain-containing protein
VATSVALLIPGGAQADDPTSRADRLRAENASLASQRERALLDLYALESRLAATERRIVSLERRAAQLELRQAAARDQLAVARADLARADDALADHLRTLYIEGEVDPFAILLGAESLEEVISALDGLGRLASQDRQIIAQLEQARVRLREAVARLAARRAEVRTLAGDAQAARASLAAARSERSSFVASLARQQELNRSQIEQLLAQAATSVELSAQVSASSGGGAPSAPPQSGQRMTVESTGYCLHGTTATGIPVAWGVIAVDPRVIPLGTRMFVPGYGEGVAADTGSAVKGAIIDLWFPTCAQAITWGRRTVTITLH